MSAPATIPRPGTVMYSSGPFAVVATATGYEVRGVDGEPVSLSLGEAIKVADANEKARVKAAARAVPWTPGTNANGCSESCCGASCDCGCFNVDGGAVAHG